MATDPKPASEDVKIDLFEDDDEFEEFEINEEWDDKEEGKELRRELESNAEKK
ncbi:hypothetical protein SESBI_02825 [Sesbania bispinosa]|nr:hypothetical protein SESBI_02825 [Sesbania bispinosa]